jgi:hypothetical protein
MEVLVAGAFADRDRLVGEFEGAGDVAGLLREVGPDEC